MDKYVGSVVKKDCLGHSIEGKPICRYILGTGPINILFWTQMHGNESTATRAMLDLCSFFTNLKLLHDEARFLLEKLTVHLIPMVNPDGAAVFERRNATGIDLNRDAKTLAAPESQILKKEIDEFKPHFAFNLHDQRRFYNVKGSKQPATISFLAPAFDTNEGINEVRLKSMQIISHMYHCLQAIIPGQVGIYSDVFSPRAFGDNCQGWGSSTILIESGWALNDPEKEFVRKLNALLILDALMSIANDSFVHYSSKDYLKIPENDEKLFDLLLRSVRVEQNSTYSNVDLGIFREELSVHGSTRFFIKSCLSDIGDLTDYFGFETVEADGNKVVVNPLVAEQTMDSVEELNEELIQRFLLEGILFVKVKNLPAGENSGIPLNLISVDYQVSANPLALEQPVNFLIKNDNDEITFRVMNGFLLDLQNVTNCNGLIYR